MIEKLNQKLTQFYHFSFIFLMLTTLCTIFYFWKLGFVDGSRNKQLHNASYIFEQIDAKKPLKEVKSVVFSENSKLAIKKLDSFQSDLNKVNNLIEDDSYIKVKKQIQLTKTEASSLISYPKVSKVISVFNEKLIKFNQFVKYKKWRTLTRSSERVLEYTKGYINKNKLDKFVNKINKEISQMKSVSENSFLKRAEKSEIISRLNSLEVEMKMLKKYISQRSSFVKAIENLDNITGKWIAKVSPELSFQKIQVEQMGRFYIMGLLGILVLTSVIFFAGFAFNRWHRKNAQGNFEKFVEEFVTNGLIGGKVQDLNLFSQHFQNFSDSTTEYIDKRMSFGSIFQEALPLSSIMLDKNLKVIWANKQFCDDWYISEEEINKDYLSWDYLSKLTNIGDDDPILEALKHKVAGIYQIQIKPNEKLDSRPYEMFVSPVRFKNQTRIMLFFYPLMNMQDTITSQARSIVNPIEKILDGIYNGSLSTEERENIEREFEIANISSLLKKFDAISNKQADANKQLVYQIEMLYEKLDKVFEVTDDIEKTNTKLGENNKSQVQNLKAFKENVISLSNVAKSLEQTSKSQFTTLSNVVRALGSNTNKVKQLKGIVDQMLVTIPKFGVIREDIKEQKSQMADAKMRFAHSLAQMVHVKKAITDSDSQTRFSNSYDRVTSEFKNLDHISSDLEKKLTTLEVLLSKTHILIGDVTEKMPTFETEHEDKTLYQSVKLIKDYNQKLGYFSDQIENTEDQIIGHLKSLYINTKNNIENGRMVVSSLEQRPTLLESSDNQEAKNVSADEQVAQKS